MRALLVALLSCAGCADDGRVGAIVRGHSDLIVSEGDDHAEILVYVSRDCFYSIKVGPLLRLSGRWKGGERLVELEEWMLSRCENSVRIDIAAEDGSSTAVEEEIRYCQQDGCSGECNGPIEADAGPDPEPDGGPEDDPRWEHLCAPCEGYPDDCGGPPNICVNYFGDGVCGPDCSEDGECPTFYGCTQVQDGLGQIVGYVCLPDPLGSECVY